jgi:hypothetical protein
MIEKIKDGSRVQRMIDRYYQRHNHGAGRSLHIVTDDGNIGDSSVQFCEQWALKNRDWTGARLARLIMRMSKTQRKRWALPSWYCRSTEEPSRG